MPSEHGSEQMELRHLRYFVAVAETESLTLAAKAKLHTSQPSLSRQIRDLEGEVGAPLLTRGARGIALTPAGRVFLDHARSVLSQVATATEAARRVAHPAKPCFVMGFLYWPRTEVDARSVKDLARRAAERRCDDIESILPAACGRPFEGNNRCSRSSTRKGGARLGVPYSREGAVDGDPAE